MWFTEDPLTPCAVFGAAGLFVLLMARPGNRMRMSLFGVVLLAIGAGAFVVDSLVVTPAERLESRVRQLCDDFRHKRPATLDYFSPSVPLLKATVQAALDTVTIETEPSLTDFRILFVNDERATTHFRANATIAVKPYGNVGHQPGRFVLTWAKEGDEWKIVNVKRMHPIQDRELGLLDQTAG
jgi:hypothetical protein